MVRLSRFCGRFVGGTLLVLLALSCNTPKSQKDGSKARDIGGVAAQFSCDELHRQFHYDYEKLRKLWPQFKSPNAACNRKVNAVISSGDGEAGIRREDIPDSLPPEKLEQLVKTEIGDREKKDLADVEGERPTIGKGVISVDPSLTWRIDRVPLPMTLDEAKAWSCQDLYRGIDQCEQQCGITRQLIIDLWRYRELFQKHWQWENKRDCRDLTGPLQAQRIVDFAFCKRPCANDDNVACTQCSFKVDDEVRINGAEFDWKTQRVTCSSKEDARHVANSYCSERTGKLCDSIKCRNTTGKDVVAARNVNANLGESEEARWSLTTSVDAFVKGDVLGSGAETRTKLAVQVSGATGFTVDANVGSPFVKRNGKPEGNLGSKFKCWARLEKMWVTEGRISATLGLAMNVGFADVGSGVTVTANAAAKVINEYVAESREILAGGLSRNHMLAECRRWVEHWKETTLQEVIERNPEVTVAIPGSWKKPGYTTWELEESGYDIWCKQADGNEGASNINRIFFDIKGDNLYLNYSVDYKNIFGADFLATDQLYPTKKGWYAVPLTKDTLPYIDKLVHKRLSDVKLAEFLREEVSDYTFDRYATDRRERPNEGHISKCWAYE